MSYVQSDEPGNKEELLVRNEEKYGDLYFGQPIGILEPLTIWILNKTTRRLYTV